MTDLLFEHADRGTFIISGPDRLKWLNGLVTCDVGSLKPGEATFGLALSSTGKIQSDLWILAAADRLFVSIAPASNERLAPLLDKMLIMEDAELSDVSSQYTWLTLHGPSTATLAVRIADAVGAIGHGQLGLVGSNDAVFVLERGRFEHWVKAGFGAIAPELRVGGSEDWQALRIEGGLPLFGLDYDSRHNPHDASLERRAVSWSKGCYLGQEVVCMQDLRGKAKRRLLPLVTSGATPARVGAPVEDGGSGQQVGEITSSAFSRRLNEPVAIAALKAGYEQGHALVVGGGSARVLSL